MLGFVLKRLVLAILVTATVSVLCFLLVHLKGDAAATLLGDQARVEDIDRLRQTLGLDRPLAVQYADWLQRVATGDFGDSLYYQRPVAELLAGRIPVTLGLGAASLTLALLIALPLGMVAALRPGSLLDQAVSALAVAGQALPTFWFALMLIWVLGVDWRLLPISGSATAAHFVMPTLALGAFAAPPLMRLTRAGMIEALASDYVRTARAKGLRLPAILIRHALRNALVPVVALAAVQFGHLLGGSVVIETVFALDGIGYFAWSAIRQNDLPVVQAIVLLISIIYVGLTFAADCLNRALDPRLDND